MKSSPPEAADMLSKWRSDRFPLLLSIDSNHALMLASHAEVAAVEGHRVSLVLGGGGTATLALTDDCSIEFTEPDDRSLGKAFALSTGLGCKGGLLIRFNTGLSVLIAALPPTPD